MNEGIGDGSLIDLRGVDMATLLSDAAESSTRTALDRLLLSNVAVLNAFNSNIS
jgi:hypothetical protein